MLEPRWRSGGMLPGDSNRDRVTLDQERSCLMPMPNLPGEMGMTFFPITKSKGHFCVLLHSNGKLLWICLSTLLSASLHYCRKIGEIPMIALGALTTHRQTFDIPLQKRL